LVFTIGDEESTSFVTVENLQDENKLERLDMMMMMMIE
jgi:hypothetical protein